MVIDNLSTVAYKCPVCGSIEFNYISIFDFSGKKGYTVSCSCNKGFVKIITKSNKKCMISMPCIACNGMHYYTLEFATLWTERISTFTCPNTGIELCFIGNDDVVRKSVDQYELQMDLLMNDIGYDDYFVNNTVMLDTIDRIHDIAEKGNLFCQCGNDDIDLQMYSDRVELVCQKCRTYEVIKASSNQDLKATLSKECIILCHDYYEIPYGTRATISALMRENNACKARQRSKH